MKRYSLIISGVLFCIFGLGFFVSLFVRLDQPYGDIFIYNIYLTIFSILFILSGIYFIKSVNSVVGILLHKFLKD